jgi:hypothetical protein
MLSDIEQKQLVALKTSCNGIQFVDPLGPTYKKLTDYLDKQPQSMLTLLASQDIKWISMLARNRLTK